MAIPFMAPGGIKKMHPTNQHTYKPVYIGEIRKDGQFDIVWQTDGFVEPDSYLEFIVGRKNTSSTYWWP